MSPAPAFLPEPLLASWARAVLLRNVDLAPALRAFVALGPARAGRHSFGARP